MIHVPKEDSKHNSSEKEYEKSGKKKSQYDHADVMESVKEETDKRYCKENVDFYGVVCAVCKIKLEKRR